MNRDIKILWEDLNQELFHFILNRVQNEDDSKDLLQEVFLKIQTKMYTLKDTTKLTSWVYQISRNTIMDYFRQKQASQKSVGAIEMPEDENEDSNYSKLSNCINSKINLLSEKYKEAILLTSFKNYTQQQLAEYKSISHSAAKSRVQRAKDILKDEILNCPNVVSDPKGKIIDYLK